MKCKSSLLLLLLFILLSRSSSLFAQDCGCDFTLLANGKVLNKGVELTLKTPWAVNANDIPIKPGDVFCFQNIQYSKGIIIANFAGTESQPIIIKNCGGQTVIDTREYGIIFRNSKHFKFLGNGDPNYKYGFKITARNKNYFFMDAKDFTTNFEIAYVEIAGASPNTGSDTSGFAGIGIKTNPLCDGSAERGVWTMYNPIIHDNYIHHTGGEGIYMGYGWYREGTINCPCPDDPSKTCPKTVRSHSIVGARVYNNITENTGLDGIQIKNADEDCEIYNNIIKNYGLRNEETQNEGLLLGEGTTGKAYNNWIENGTGNGIQNHAMGNQDIFNNVIINPKEYGFVCWDGPAVVRVGYYNFFNNTIINAGLDGFNFFGPGGGPKRVYNNIIAKAGPGRSLLKKANDVILFEESNNYLTNNIEDVQFVSGTAPYDMRLLPTSPAIDKGKDLTSFGVTTDFDLNTRPYGAAFDIGAFEFRNFPPVVTITEPLDEAVFLPGSKVTIKADASDVDGSVTKVEFYIGTTKVGEDLTAPYSFEWTPEKEGTYTIKVVATDDGGGTSSSTITVVIKNSLPEITITKPAASSSHPAGKAITIEADATDSDGTISNVEFFYTTNNKDTIQIGSSTTSPYQVSWTPLSTGTYKIIARATDNLGATSQTAISINVTNTLPTISITAPVNNSTHPFGTAVEIKVNAADADGSVIKVEFFNGTTKIGESTTSPFTFLWEDVALGTYTITAKATDNIGGTTTSLPVQFSISNTPPVVTIKAPLNNAKFSPGSDITIEATATDEDGTITKVEFFYNSTQLIGSVTTAPYSISWKNVPEGSYTITVRATDNAGATSSKTINITVVNNPPAVTITSPIHQSQYESGADIEITAEASDSDGTISKVVFYNGSTILGEALTAPYSYTWTGVPNGTYSITAVAYDNLGKQNVSEAVQVIVQVTTNIPPAVKVTKPSTNQTVAPGTITIEVEATDTDGEVTLVELFNGTTKIGETTALPYTFTWNITTEGVYVITAKAIDDDNETSTSSPVSITVYNAPPVVTITTPANNQTFDSDDQIVITATATDSDGTISKVEFYLNDSLVGTVTTAPYTLTLDNISSGTYNITVKATDNFNKEGSDAIAITVNNKLPSISIISPTDGASFQSSDPVLFDVEANDTDGFIQKVEYYINGTLVATRPSPDFAYTWNNAPVGEHEIVAYAIDNDGAKVASAPVTITILNTPPVVTINTPANNQTFDSDDQIIINATVTDADGSISKVEFYLNGSLAGTVTSTPYTLNVNDLPPGSYTVIVKATDNLDEEGSATVQFTISNKLPSISIIVPVDGATFQSSNPVLIEVEAQDSDGSVQKVEYYINGTLVATRPSPDFSYTWNNAPVGTHEIVAYATDNDGAKVASAPVTITILNTPPVVTINTPANNQTFDSDDPIVINATVTDADGTISKVEFYLNGSLAGTVTSAPYTLKVNDLLLGSYTIIVKATDNLDEEGSATAQFTISNKLPSISIIAPIDGTTFDLSESVLLNVEAQDPDGSVQKVEYYINGDLVATRPAPDFSYTWNNAPVGEYEIVAYATDNDGGKVASAPVTITILNTPPVVTITAPVNNQTFDSDDQIVINATVTGANGNISKVEFYLNGSLAGTVTSGSYTLTLDDLPAGTYTILVKATDIQGEEGSATIQFKISNKLPSISIIAPVDGSTFNLSESVLLNVEAQDPDGSVQKVEYYINGDLVATRPAPDFSYTWDNAPVGEHEIVAYATDNDGAQVASVPVYISVIKKPVTVTLISPEADLTYELGTPIDFVLDVDGLESPIVKIEYYVNDVKIGESSTPDAQFTWTNTGEGDFEVYAVITGEDGKRDTSNKVSISIKNSNILPIISITSPEPNSTYSSCSEIVVNATSSDEDGEILKVEFSVNNKVVSTDISAPYSFSVSNLDPGSQTITATAYDNRGGKRSTSISIVIIEKPQVSFYVQSGNETINSASGKTVETTTLDSVHFVNTSYINPSQIKAFEWSLSDGTTSNENMLTHNFIEGGLYKASLILTDIYGCTTSKEIAILVKDTALNFQDPFWIPNALSPYETNPENKVIKIYGKLSPDDFSFSIYSRWGQLLYSTTNLAEAQNVGWDGDNAPMDTYTYVLKAKETNGKKVEKSGTITLIR